MKYKIFNKKKTVKDASKYHIKHKNKVSFKDSIVKVFFLFRALPPAKHILTLYLAITFVGAILLWMPFSQTGFVKDPIHSFNVEGRISFVDALFTSASSFSDTGLSPHVAAITFNVFGQAIIATQIFIGGIGWFALRVYIFNIIFNRPLAFRTREALASERGSVKVGVTKSLISSVVTFLLVMIVIFSLILSIYFYYVPPSDPNSMRIPVYKSVFDGLKERPLKIVNLNPHNNPYLSIRDGIFHTISALNNAGFDILSTSSLAPYYENYLLQNIFVILFVIGGLGYPVLYDCYRFFQTRITGESFSFSLFTKLSSTAYLFIAAAGITVTFIIETTAQDSFWDSPTYGDKGQKSMAIFFNTMSTRNAGFSTVSMQDLSRGTLVQYTIMMFIGSAPSSTAGGIRTTTMAIVLLGIWSRLRGRNSVYAFKRKIDEDTVRRSYVVFTVSILIVVIATLISISSFRSNGGSVPTISSIAKENPSLAIKDLNTSPYVAFDFTELIFEVGSAFGTTGLSTGMTPMLSIYTKFTLIFVMFIGQIGISSSILIWGRRKSPGKSFSRVVQDITIG